SPLWCRNRARRRAPLRRGAGRRRRSGRRPAPRREERVNPLSFLRQLDYPGTKSVLLVQTAPAQALPLLVARLREGFPACAIDAVVREADAAVRDQLDGAQVEAVRSENRFASVSRLRRQRYDVVALALHAEGPGELRALPYLVRARSIVAFNENLDHFPLNVHRLDTIAHHFGLLSGQKAGIGRGLFWLVRGTAGKLVAAPARLAFLLASVGWLYVRGAVRRLRRGERQAGARAASAAR